MDTKCKNGVMSQSVSEPFLGSASVIFYIRANDISIKPLTAKIFNFNFHPVEAVSR